MGTVTFGDLYGGYNQATQSRTQSGQTTGRHTSAMTGLMRDTPQAAMFWAGLVFMLVVLRVLIEYK